MCMSQKNNAMAEIEKEPERTKKNCRNHFCLRIFKNATKENSTFPTSQRKHQIVFGLHSKIAPWILSFGLAFDFSTTSNIFVSEIFRRLRREWAKRTERKEVQMEKLPVSGYSGSCKKWYTFNWLQIIVLGVHTSWAKQKKNQQEEKHTTTLDFDVFSFPFCWRLTVLWPIHS